MSVAEMANPVAAAAAAEDLLKPEIEEEEKGAGEGGDDDELEALRLAALNSIRPKKKVEVPPPQPMATEPFPDTSCSPRKYEAINRSTIGD